tara:strand:+ start:151 stop:756 length:606 start_codon:yes stop_codon:yes gene_type:complete
MHDFHICGMMGVMKLVLSQSYQNDPLRRDTEQELVSSLLMQDRIEVILVQDVAQLENESTDALCLQGIRGDMLVAAWHNTVDCTGHLRRLGIVGKFDGETVTAPVLPIALPSGQYDAMQRRIAFLDLTGIADPTSSRQQILTLLRDGKQNRPTIRSKTDDAVEQPDLSPTKPIKAMPRRIEETTSLDDLDLLLDEIDGANL